MPVQTPEMVGVEPGSRKRKATAHTSSAMNGSLASWARGEQKSVSESSIKKAKNTRSGDDESGSEARDNLTTTTPTASSESALDVPTSIKSSLRHRSRTNVPATSSLPTKVAILPAAMNTGTPAASPRKASLRKASPRKANPRKVAKSRRKTASPKKNAVAPSTLPDTRSEPYGQPEVWSMERQALCESVPYYQAYQSGAYTFEGLGHGFLIDNDSGERQFVDEEVVIARAGGGCTQDSDGKSSQTEDQTTSVITCFANNKKTKTVVGIIVGSKNDNFPTKVPHRYCVLAWFQVTDTWAEKSNGKKVYKIRFEKIDLASKSWWAPAGSPMPPVTRNFNAKPFRQTCDCCKQEQPQIFDIGWVCLNDQCVRFWSHDGKDLKGAQLRYNDAFVKERTEWDPKNKPSFQLKPDPPLSDDASGTSVSYSHASWKGIVCPVCGRCISRIEWDAWFCETQGCDFKLKKPKFVLSHLSVLSNRGVEAFGHAVPRDSYSDPVTTRDSEFFGNYRIETYDVAPDCHITHYLANGIVNREPGGAHDMFRAMQEANFGLKRYPMKSSAMEGLMHTAQFATNYGMPYNYVVDVDSKGFSEAPDVVMNALNRLTWAGKRVVKDGSFEDFNEELVLGYFEKQKIGYHDDGEEDLGPTIATLSLGGEAAMTVRLKKKHFNVKNMLKETYDPEAFVFPHSQLYEERNALNRLYGTVNSAEFENAKKGFLEKLKRIRTVNAPVILKLRLRHGDMVVMHGADIQRYWEHSITPDNKLRFGLTCRFVKPENIDPAHHWKGDFSIDPVNVYTGGVGTENENTDITRIVEHNSRSSLASRCSSDV